MERVISWREVVKKEEGVIRVNWKKYSSLLDLANGSHPDHCMYEAQKQADRVLMFLGLNRLLSKKMNGVSIYEIREYSSIKGEELTEKYSTGPSLKGNRQYFRDVETARGWVEMMQERNPEKKYIIDSKV